jgi:hypothetical protein
MADYNDMQRGTSREWAAARVVLILGFVIAIAVAGYFAWQRHQDEVAAQQQIDAAEQQANRPAMTPAQAAQNANTQAAMMVCAMELVNAKNLGIVPPFGQLANLMPQPTKTRGRYICQAGTQVSKYELSADIICSTLTNPNCVKLYSIKSDDGTTLYQRK